MKEACRTSRLSAELAERMKLCKTGTVQEAGQREGLSDKLIHRMIVGSGIDLVEIERIHQSMERFGSRFLDRVFTAAEQAYCLRKRNAAESLAARFAAKEAAAKALGTGISHGVSWLEIEVIREPGGRPSIRFQGRAAEIAEQIGVGHVALSLTHTSSLAMASVTLESRK
jgi:holo-[acyl-carrier protein] synthase